MRSLETQLNSFVILLDQVNFSLNCKTIKTINENPLSYQMKDNYHSCNRYTHTDMHTYMSQLMAWRYIISIYQNVFNFGKFYICRLIYDGKVFVSLTKLTQFHICYIKVWSFKFTKITLFDMDSIFPEKRGQIDYLTSIYNSYVFV